jgi:hypothetical protein
METQFNEDNGQNSESREVINEQKPDLTLTSFPKRYILAIFAIIFKSRLQHSRCMGDAFRKSMG